MYRGFVMVNVLNANYIGTNACQKSFSTEKAEAKEHIKLKDMSIGDLIDIKQGYENTPVIGSPFLNYQKLDLKLSVEDIQKFNENKKLPEGYKLVFKPKKIVTKYLNGAYNGTDVTPPTYFLCKAEQSGYAAAVLANEATSITDSIPEGFKLLNNSKGETYIVSDKETTETLDKKTRSLFEKIAGIFKKQDKEQ